MTEISQTLTAPPGAALTDSERDRLGHAFEATPPFFKLLSTLRTRRVGLGYRCETGEAEVLEVVERQDRQAGQGPAGVHLGA